MPRIQRLHERIGTVFMPEADTIAEDDPAHLEGPEPAAEVAVATPAAGAEVSTAVLPQSLARFPFPRLCVTSLKQGCYTIGFTPAKTPILGTRYRGTMRVERTGTGLRISADLYAFRLLDDIVGPLGGHLLGDVPQARFSADEAADTGGTIPIYRRSAYHSYLKGTKARLFSLQTPGVPCSFTLELDEFVYNQPASGFSGSFDPSPTRSIRWVLSKTATPDLYQGVALDGTTSLGSVAMRWISDSYRRAEVTIHTLDGAVTPPADVGGTTMASIYADAGWSMTVTDGGGISLPAPPDPLSGVDPAACWSTLDLHRLMATVPGYDSAELDSVWRIHLLAVPARLGCSRGIMFDTGGGDPDGVPREGSATFSHDGYPAAESSCYGTAADRQQKDVPRAYLRSATHETGHAFNQIHQGYEGGNDNSIMTPTPGVAGVLCSTNGFPDQVNLGFNETVKKHLRHYPDPAVRSGAMDFFGSAIAAPEPADVAWPDSLRLSVKTSTTRVALGEPISLGWELTNVAATPVPAPTRLDVESLVARVSVTDPTGEITFMRPPLLDSCPRIWIEPLAPGESVRGSTTLYWGTDGFAFERPGRHRIEVIALWDVAGAPVAVSGEVWVFVCYPTSSADNEVAALLLHPEVGRAVAVGEAAPYAVASERIAKAATVDEAHPATTALRERGLVEGAEAEEGAPA